MITEKLEKSVTEAANTDKELSSSRHTVTQLEREARTRDKETEDLKSQFEK